MPQVLQLEAAEAGWGPGSQTLRPGFLAMGARTYYPVGVCTTVPSPALGFIT